MNPKCFRANDHPRFSDKIIGIFIGSKNPLKTILHILHFICGLENENDS
jgi:hypothetical protein